MKKITFFIGAVLFISAFGGLHAQDEAAMKAWQAYMTPGDVHKMIAESDGSWNEEVTTWMTPDAAPTKSTATVENKMILGGRYQQSTHTGNFNGMPFEGFSILGYDNAKKVFLSSWIDNMGTGIMQMQGTWDPATKTIQFNGVSVDPITGKDVPVRQTFTLVDNNNQKMEMYMTQDGKEMKTMEISLTRK
ncbi:MAG TPA: DUF1579 domain-containing protein [Hanamia sp.]